MLTLTRRIGEKIIIANNIICTVLDVQENHIRLGFIAPDDVAINREEIHVRNNLMTENSKSSYRT